MSHSRSELSAQAQAFIDWARDAAVPVTTPRKDADYDDLHFIHEVIGPARVVALGESAHYMHEWNRFRARLFKHLALHHGFNVFVLETGLVESQAIHDYVNGADVDWDVVVTSITNGWGVWAEIQELIAWMRAFNLDASGDRRLRFYGMDGSGNWSHAQRAYVSVIGFLQVVDEPFSNEVANVLAEKVQRATFERRELITEATWAEINATCNRVVERIEEHQATYAERVSPDRCDWSLRCAHAMRDVLLAIQRADLEFRQGFRAFWNTRDEAMAEQLQWILEREGPDARLVVGAHNTHLQHYPVRVQRATSMGSYFTRRVGRENVLLIGAANAKTIKQDAPRPDSNQAIYEQIGHDRFFLDLRRAPESGPVADWLYTERADRSNLRYHPVAPGIAWDCLLYQSSVAIGEVALPASLQRRIGPPLTERFDDLIGDYVLDGFLGQPTSLSVRRDGNILLADGRVDTSGELFPPLETPIEAAEDGRFIWANWPAVLEFHGQGRADGVTITMPGMGVYHGQRVAGFG